MTEATQNTPIEQTVKGRSVFLVETTPAGIAVQTALLTEDGKLLNAPAVFPDVEYAFAQVDELKRLISTHFSQAALLGAQVASQQAQAAATNAPLQAEATAASAEEDQAPPEPAIADASAPEETGNGRKTLDSLKKFVYSGLSQVSKITQSSGTAPSTPESADQEGDTVSAPARKPRSSGKKAKATD